jgi:hypothetical protein
VNNCIFENYKDTAPTYIIDAWDTGGASVSQFYLNQCYFECNPHPANIIKAYGNDMRFSKCLLSGASAEAIYAKFSDGSITDSEIIACGSASKALVYIEGGYVSIHDNYFSSTQSATYMLYLNSENATYSIHIHDNTCYYESVTPDLYYDATSGATGSPFGANNTIGSALVLLDREVRGERVSATAWCLGAKRKSESYPRWVINAEGKQWWNSAEGTADAWDCNLYRIGSAVLGSDNATLRGQSLWAQAGDVYVYNSNYGLVLKAGTATWRVKVTEGGTLYTEAA